MAADAIAQIDAPGQGGGGAKGVVLFAGEQAADAADGDADGERDGEDIASAAADAGEAFSDLDREGVAGECADHALAAEQIVEIGEGASGQERVFTQVEQLGAEDGACNGGDDDVPAGVGVEEIAGFVTLVEIETEGGDVGERFKDKVPKQDLLYAASGSPFGEVGFGCNGFELAIFGLQVFRETAFA